MKRIVIVLALALAAAAAVFAGGQQDNSKKPIVFVWYPNNSVDDLKAARTEITSIIAKATGRPVEDKLTTDYNIAIEAIANGQAALCFPGALGYIQAKQKNKAVVPVVVNTGASGTLDDAYYYSRIGVRSEDAAMYMKGNAYSIAGLEGKSFSFVSPSSTSGFLFPSTYIASQAVKIAKWSGLKQPDLAEGGADKFFSQVLFGSSHQGSLANLLNGKVDAAAFDDVDVMNYVDLVSGDVNKPGTVYKVKADATEPFNQLGGKQFTILQWLAVKNAPIIANSQVLSDKEIKAIQAALTSADVTGDQKIFVPKGADFKGMFTKTANEHFITVDDAWYAPIYQMLQ